MKMERAIQLGFLMLGAVCAVAQTSPSPPAGSGALTTPNAPVPPSHSLFLSNKAVLIVSAARGVNVNAVKLKFSDAMSGRFEIQVDGARDLQREAELLSKDLGTNIAVIVDEATADGRMRTNYVFRNGAMRQTVAPVGNIGLPPGGRRMYVWPETTKLSAPKNLRIVQTE